MTRIRTAFASADRPLFIPFIMGGDPDLDTTERCLRALARAGADVIELGVPFSDPIADGPTNQRAAVRALEGGVTLRAVLERLGSMRRAGFETPLVLFTYLNPLLALGDDLGALARAGVDGVLALDLPPEEAQTYEEALARLGLDRIYLAAPSTPSERLDRLAEVGSGFVYYVCRYGVTGARNALPSELAARVREVRQRVGRPVAVGFGIAEPEQAREVARHADAVVVGSALVAVMEAHGREAAGPLEAAAGAFAEAVPRGPEFTETHAPRWRRGTKRDSSAEVD